MGILEEEYGVGCCVANRPVYADVLYLRERTAGQDLPQSDELGRRLFCVALHPLMTEAENEYVAAALWDAEERVRRIYGDPSRSVP
jgi:dTDP-4-amino-4,6-dideoxygalactose transaminase